MSTWSSKNATITQKITNGCRKHKAKTTRVILINVLQKIEDKSLLIRVIETNDFDIDGNPKPNFWLNEIEVSETEQSGYEQNGEIRLIGSE